MSVHIVRLGSQRGKFEGLRIGTVRRPPRGVKRENYARENWYDVWLPLLAPSAEAVKQALAAKTEREWSQFAARYRREMKHAEAQRTLVLLAALSHQTDFSVGCYCADENRCHRSLLRELFFELGAAVADESAAELGEV